MLRTSSRRFTWLHDLFGLVDKNSTSYKVGTISNFSELPDHSPIIREQQDSQVQISTLPNGVRILTETARFPNSVFMGLLIETGSRDEDMKTAGTCMALKNTYLKSNSRTNEQLNYGIIQMSGGSFTMDYTQELMYFQGYCLAHDTYDYIQMMSDCLLDEFTLMDEEAALWRIDEYWKLREQTISNDKRLEELWLSTAYGFQGLGMPLAGFQSTFQDLGYYKVNSFKKNCITPDRMIVCASGIYDHKEFVDAVTPYYAPLEPVKAWPRQQAKYLGGEHREICDGFLTYINLSFQSCSWKDPDMPAFQVLRQLVGEGGGFSSGGPGKGMHSRSYTHFLSKYPWIDSVKATNSCFTDSGNFGVTIICLNAYSGYAGDALTNELIDLTKVTDVEVERAKNLLKINLLITLEKSQPRLEDTAKLYSVLGNFSEQNNYLNMIDKVTPEQVRKAAQKMLKTRPTLVVLGGDTHFVPSADVFAKRLGSDK